MRLTRSLLALSLLLGLTGAAHAANTVSDVVATYDNLRAGDAHTASNFTFTAGHGTYTLASGTVSAVFAGDTQVGLFLAGNGTFRYETVNKDELPALRYNAKNGGVKSFEVSADKATITTDFTSALLLGTGLPEASGAAAASQQTALKQNADLFARTDLTMAPPAHLLTYQRLDNPSARVLYARIQGSQPFVHVYDDAYDNDETLRLLLRPEMRGTGGRFNDILYPVLLSQQAIGRGNRQAPAPRALLTDLDVNLVGNMNEEGTLKVTETIVPQKRALNALHFDLIKTIFLETESRDRHFNLRSVTDDQGRKLSFSHENDDLLVGLAEPAPAGKPIKLTFDIDGNFLYRQDKTNYWELGIEPWFPWLRLHEQAFRFHSLIKVEKPFVVFASGKSLKRTEEGNYNVIETQIDNPVDYIAILAGKYQYSEEVRKGVMIRVASFISKNEDAYKKIRAVAEAAIDYYPFFLGPFPFDEINVIEKDSRGQFAYGQAPAGIVFITSEAFKPRSRELDDMTEGVNARFAHELAHMYFGNAVRRPTEAEQWLDEAFAEYAASLFMKAGKSGAGDYQKMFIHWRDDAKVIAENGTISTANRLNNPGDRFGQAMARQGLIYFKGAYLLAALHKDMGDQMFLTFLKSYQKSFRWKQATTKDVIDLLQFLTKKDYAPFFEQYYYGTAMPDVKLK
ncbi:MAG TPA: M1 family aminopeptidase [Thermoanaerobaculia bacterium]|nr:M1 family aminopeptidase [Thermoanaerobaculia bacterium]